MDDTEYDEFFHNIVLPGDVRKRLERTLEKPEGDVEARWVHRLITHYMYSPKQIATGVPAGAGRNAATSTVTADIVVYRDLHRREPFIVIEAKKPGELPEKGIKQAESYARNIGAEYHVWSDFYSSSLYFKTAKYIAQSSPVANIPSWTGGKPCAEYISKQHVLPPFRDEEHLRNVVKRCHDKIFHNLEHDPAKSFDELMKMLFLKMYDERETPGQYEFAALPGHSKSEIADLIRSLFSKATRSNRYRDVFTTRFSRPGDKVRLDLDDDTIYYIVNQFGPFSLVNTTSSLEGVDIKGTVFERMVGSTFRGELGAYFTPRELVEFCVEMLDPSSDNVVLDPSCGSGGFLIMVLKHVLERIKRDNPNLSETEIYAATKDFAEKNLYGIDINERMVRVCKMNMIMHGDGHGGIFNSHGLTIGVADRIPLTEGSVGCVFSNPPFVGREEDPAYLGRFETAKTDDGTIVSLHKSIPFVEMIIKLLAPGGAAALVLPNSIFNSTSRAFRKLREIIYTETTILAVIALPHWVFFHTGCDVQGSLLFLKKATPPTDYDIFMDWADNVGFDAKGAKTGANDLPDILKRFSSKPRANCFRLSEVRRHDRFDALFYRQGDFDQYQSPSAITLGDIAEPSGVTVSKSRTNNSTYRYLEVNGADPETGKIVTLHEHPASALPSRAKWIVREGMVLLPNHRNSLRSQRATTIVPEEYDGIVVTSRFIPLFCKVPPTYVAHILNLDIVREKILKMVTGGSSTEIRWEQIRQIPIPAPPHGDYDSFLADVMELESKKERYRTLLEEKRSELHQRFMALFT